MTCVCGMTVERDINRWTRLTDPVFTHEECVGSLHGRILRSRVHERIHGRGPITPIGDVVNDMRGLERPWPHSG